MPNVLLIILSVSLKNNDSVIALGNLICKEREGEEGDRI